MHHKIILQYLQKLATEQSSFPEISSAKKYHHKEYQSIIENPNSSDKEISTISAQYLDEVLGYGNLEEHFHTVELILQNLDADPLKEKVVRALADKDEITEDFYEGVLKDFIVKTTKSFIESRSLSGMSALSDFISAHESTLNFSGLAEKTAELFGYHLWDAGYESAEFTLKALYKEEHGQFNTFFRDNDVEFYFDEYAFFENTLGELLDEFEESEKYPEYHYAVEEYIRGQVENLSNSEIVKYEGQDTLNRLGRFGFIQGTGVDPEDIQEQFGINVPEEHHFGDRTESLTYLNGLTKKHGGKISWSVFQDESGLRSEDKSHFEFFRKIFTNQRGHIVTQDYVEELIKAQGTQEHQIAYSTYAGSGPQNSTGTKQLVFLLEVPDEVKRELKKEPHIHDFFDKLWNNAQEYAGHPGSFGWVRVSLLGDASPEFKHAWLIDEVQSDVMYSSRRKNIALYRLEYHNFQKALASFKSTFSDTPPRPKDFMPNFTQDFPDIPVTEFPKIDQTINKFFGNWHKILLSAIMHTARENGITDLYMPTPEYMYEKSNITQGSHKSIKIYDQLPKLFHFTKVKIDLPSKSYSDNYSRKYMVWHRKAKKRDLQSVVLQAFIDKVSLFS